MTQETTAVSMNGAVLATKHPTDAEDVVEVNTAGDVRTDEVDRRRPKRDLSVRISLRTFVIGAIFAGLLSGLGYLGWLYHGARTELAQQAQHARDDQRAEKTALDYAVNAAVMNYKNLPAWQNNLVKGTTPELKDKLAKAATSMEQILAPLEWDSSAQPLVAKVRTNNGDGTYVVDAFVSVLTKTAQAPDGLQSTATYSVTMDSKHDWVITDVGGIADMAGPK
jgi:Mce-associated membrane protein